jgi:hypothetical protein
LFSAGAQHLIERPQNLLPCLGIFKIDKGGIMKKSNPDKKDTHITGMAWYKREQWPTLLQVSSDSKSLESTYDKWIEFAEEEFKRFTEKGVQTEKVSVDVFKLIEWCKDHNRPVNGSSRAAYVAELLFNLHK